MRRTSTRPWRAFPSLGGRGSLIFPGAVSSSCATPLVNSILPLFGVTLRMGALHRRVPLIDLCGRSGGEGDKKMSILLDLANSALPWLLNTMHEIPAGERHGQLC